MNTWPRILENYDWEVILTPKKILYTWWENMIWVYNVDETDLYWQLLSYKTYGSINAGIAAGMKTKKKLFFQSVQMFSDFIN